MDGGIDGRFDDLGRSAISSIATSNIVIPPGKTILDLEGLKLINEKGLSKSPINPLSPLIISRVKIGLYTV